MEKGVFAVYNAKIYKVSSVKGNLVRLVSSDKNDKKNGFYEKIYQSTVQNTSTLPQLFVKEVKKEEVDKIYEVDFKAKFNGNVYNLTFNKVTNSFTLGTNDAKLARENGFERTDKYYYEKQINEDEIEIIKEIKHLN